MRVAVFPVPYDATTSYKGGAREGPMAIIEASRQIEFYDHELKREIIERVAVETLPELAPSSEGPGEVARQIEGATREILKSGAFPLMLGGEHSITLGAVRALRRKYKQLSILQIDAHTDLRNSYEGSRYNHACIMRRLWDIGCRVVAVGIRSGSKEDLDFIAKKKALMFYGNEFDESKVVKGLGQNVYITIDLDGFDPAYVPATGTPEPGGLNWQEVTKLLRAVAKERNIVGADIVELAPIPGQVASDFLAARLAYKIIGYVSERVSERVA